MFDFPTSPTVGQASNGYVFNGVGWAGGPIAGQPTDQFFDLSGLSTLDITVPSWAKAVHLDGTLFTGVTTGFAMVQLSMDGTTFIAGSNYQIGGPVHNSGTSPYYATQGAVVAPGFYLSYPVDNLNFPHSFSADMNLVIGATGLLACRAFNTAYRNAAPTQFETRWFSSYLNQTGPLSVKKLRFNNGAGPITAAGAGSYLRVKWLGASADIPQSNAPGEAPQTGGEYVRVNGVWRLKSQTLVLDGATQVGVPVAVPTNARAVKFSGSINIGNNAASLSASMRWSVDGTTFPAGAADYSYSGSYFGSVAGPAALPSATASYALMTISSASANCPVKFDGSLQLSRTGTQLLLGKCYSTSLQAGNHYQGLIQFWAAGAAFNPPTVLRALSFGAHGNAVTLAADSYVDVEWVY
jgi:hypothetical protein